MDYRGHLEKPARNLASFLGSVDEVSKEESQRVRALGTYEEDEDVMEDRESARRRTTLESTSSTQAPGAGAPEVTVRSTRRGKRLAQLAKRDEKRKILSSSTLIPESISGVGTDDDPDLVGNELTQDAAFLTKLRDFLRNSRRLRRSKKRPAALTNTIAQKSLLSTFLQSLGNTPVLSSRHERRLSRIIARGNAVRAAAKALALETGRVPSLTTVAESVGLTSANDAAQAVVLADISRNLMVDFNTRMVVSIAKRYLGNGIEFSDLITEGMYGLRRSIDKFDATKGFKFSTYAHWWIRQAVTRAISDQSRDVRLPVHVVEFLVRLQKVSDEMKADPSRTTPLTRAELAAAMGVPLSRLMAILRASKSPRSAEELASSGGSGSNVKDLGAAVADPSEGWCEEDEPAGDSLKKKESDDYLRESLQIMLSTLPMRERNILCMRYGLDEHAVLSGEETDDDNGEGMGLKDVGLKYDLSRERIRQIENKALNNLQKPWRMQLLSKLSRGEPISDAIKDHIKAQTMAAWEEAR